MFEEGVAIGAVSEGDIEDLGVFERLLYAGPDDLIIVFRLDYGDGDARLVEKEVVRFLGFTALDRLAANDDSAFREVYFLPKLGHHIPFAVWTDKCRSDELGADVRFGEFFFVHLSDLINAEREPRVRLRSSSAL